MGPHLAGAGGSHAEDAAAGLGRGPPGARHAEERRPVRHSHTRHHKPALAPVCSHHLPVYRLLALITRLLVLVTRFLELITRLLALNTRLLAIIPRLLTLLVTICVQYTRPSGSDPRPSAGTTDYLRDANKLIRNNNCCRLAAHLSRAPLSGEIHNNATHAVYV